jgi:[acyl-carrier-protein] S-malonyltransferase
MGVAFLFPGQGSQEIGMGADFFNTFDNVKKRFDEANEIVGRDLKKIIFEGPDAELTSTRNTQPALFTVETAIADCIMEKGITPTVTLGHSLGEYSALYAAGVISFQDGVKIVAKRGELMAAVGAKVPGTMAAVIGLPKDKIAEVLKTVDAGVVVPANENSPDQTVISGEPAAVKAAGEKLSAAGAKRVMPLPVSGAFHSPLMQPVADDLQAFLSSIEFKTPRCPVISNVLAAPVTDGAELKRLLITQLLSPVRWVDSMRYLAANGITSAIEVGPKTVLKGLAKKCSETLNVIPCATVDNLYSLQ